ncbi:MAG: rhomboid family intramembrane serine protease [Acidobacteria bacterium]|nr:rhomboid family intramembrane serine protease [Acidobacteriota bacterium]
MIPLKDDNPTRTMPFVTVSLIVANAAVFFWERLLPPDANGAINRTMGVTPSNLTHFPLEAERLLHGGLSLFTAMFLHGGIPHVAFNMLYLWIFGNNVEDVMGHGRFLVFYLACGLIASFTQVAASPSSRVPMIGASGAVSGILGAYLVLFPAARVLTLVFVVFFVRVIPFPAIIILGFWFLLQLLQVGPVAAGGVAVLAHVGGFVAGIALIAAFRRHRPRQSLF